MLGFILIYFLRDFVFVVFIKLSVAALSSDAYFLSFLAPLPREITQRYRYQYDNSNAHTYADPYDFLIEPAGRVT